MLVKSQNASKKINKSIFLMGSLRSGTTITSRLISSCKDIAYLYEQTSTDLMVSLLYKNFKKIGKFYLKLIYMMNFIIFCREKFQL